MICNFTFDRDNQLDSQVNHEENKTYYQLDSQVNQEENKTYYQKNNGQYIRDNKLYYKDHKEQYKKYRKDSYNNKETCKQNVLRWRLKNPDYYLNWYNNNRDKILQKSKEHWRQQQNNEIKCEICNMELLVSSLGKHILTKRHIRNENKNNNENIIT